MGTIPIWVAYRDTQGHVENLAQAAAEDHVWVCGTYLNEVFVDVLSPWSAVWGHGGIQKPYCCVVMLIWVACASPGTMVTSDFRLLSSTMSDSMVLS